MRVPKFVLAASVAVMPAGEATAGGFAATVIVPKPPPAPRSSPGVTRPLAILVGATVSRGDEDDTPLV